MKYFIILVLLFPCTLHCQVTTFADIKPIIDSKCLPCHQSQEIAPFSLDGYADIKGKASTILYVVNNKLMPPWLPDTSYNHFKNERILTAVEVNTINNWVKGGKVNGNKKIQQKNLEAKPLKLLPDTSFFIDELLEPTGNEKYVDYSFKLKGKKGACIKRVEFTPVYNGKNIHHCNLGVFSDSLQTNDNTLFIAGWTRGNSIPEFPENTGFIVDSVAYVNLEIHYTMVPVNNNVKAQISIYYTNEEPKRKLLFMDCGGVEKLPPDTYLPANKIKTYHVVHKLDKKITLFSVYPHMHIFGKSLNAFAITKGDTIPLIKINKWDFDWQEQYLLKKPLILDKDTEVHLFYTYDNTSHNLLNPNNPPRPVLFNGMKSDEEMLNLFFHYLDYWDGDEDITEW